jgi:hypothetical protein
MDLRLASVQPILSVMPDKLKAIIAAAALGAALGIQSPVWVFGLRTEFTFSGGNGAETATSSSYDATKWLSKIKVMPLWAPRMASAARTAGGMAAIAVAYGLSVFGILLIFGDVRRGRTLIATGGGLLISILVDVRIARAGASQHAFLCMAGIASGLLGATAGYRFALRKMKKAPA